MRIAFASAHPYLPQIAGGSQSNTHEMALELRERGHHVSVLAGLTRDGWIGLRNRAAMKLTRRKAIGDSTQPYPVYRGWFAWEGVADLMRAEAPEVAVVQSGQILRLAKAFREAGVPLVIYLHNVEFDDHGEDMAAFKDAVFLANSQFTAERYRAAYGIEASVINPLFQPDRYTVSTTRESVLFVNPHPLKGVDLALDLARLCPDIPFDFVESWTLSDEHRRSLNRQVSALGNITLHPRTADMRAHYGRARIVLVPSRWEETWGRIASEAHYSGIPVIAARVGGLPEAVGPGGVLIDPKAGPDEWAAALRELWNRRERYDALSNEALRYAQRPQIDRNWQISRLMEVIETAIARR